MKRINAAIAAFLLAAGARAELTAEIGKVNTLPAASPHWVWISDIVFNHMEAGKAYLVDGDTGYWLGMLSTGFNSIALTLPRDRSAIYSAETYLERGTRGKRSDVVTIYSAAELSPVGEIEIPAKRAESNATLWHATLTDDDRFMLIYNFTPAQSVSVVDVQQRRFAGEIDAPGCALTYPSGNRRFHMICGDGSLLTVTLDDSGLQKTKSRSEPFFAPDADFVTEKAERYGDQLLFASAVRSNVVPVGVGGDTPQALAPWPLLTDEDRAQDWRIGGIQHFAVHQKKGLLFALMHQGGIDTFKDPGTEVWVYDIANKKRVQRIVLADIATSIQVTQDDAPLLFTLFVGKPALEIYDATSGRHRLTVPEVGFTPTVLQTPVR
ncbi:MAG: amine dehydrogenase [Gammaproteobacteria bacterium]|nr:amine dehydrogenase [Gammaproteobacteria bacterium]